MSKERLSVTLDEARTALFEQDENFRYPYLWDGSVKEFLKMMPSGLSKEADAVKQLLNQEYEITAKFSSIKECCGENVYCNEKAIMYRRKKFGPVHFAKGVELLEGTPTSGGGSNSYPTPSFKEGYCILRWKTKGFPILSRYSYRWYIQIIELKTQLQ